MRRSGTGPFNKGGDSVVITAFLRQQVTFEGREHIREHQISVLCWLVYLILTVIYCASYEVFILSSSPQLLVDLIWFAREWGLWVVLTPVMFRFLRKKSETTGVCRVDYAVVGLSAFLLTLSFSVTLDMVTASAESLAQSLVLHAPRYFISAAAIPALWLALFNKKQQQGNAPENNCSQNKTALNSTKSQILAYKGSDKCLVTLNNIEFARAARNYIELHSPEGMYLLRSTIKQLEELLPPELFMRTHRSIIVKINSIERIQTLPSGSAKVLLHNGESVPMSKRYISRLQDFQANK